MKNKQIFLKISPKNLQYLRFAVFAQRSRYIDNIVRFGGVSDVDLSFDKAELKEYDELYNYLLDL